MLSWTSWTWGVGKLRITDFCFGSLGVGVRYFCFVGESNGGANVTRQRKRRIFSVISQRLRHCYFDINTHTPVTNVGQTEHTEQYGRKESGGKWMNMSLMTGLKVKDKPLESPWATQQFVVSLVSVHPSQGQSTVLSNNINIIISHSDNVWWRMRCDGWVGHRAKIGNSDHWVQYTENALSPTLFFPSGQFFLSSLYSTL